MSSVETKTASNSKRPPLLLEQQEIQQVLISSIEANPYQPRQLFDKEKLQKLANSIREDGVLQPVILNTRKNRYTVVVGERRVRAAELAGYTSVPAIVRDFVDADVLRLALVENVQRCDLNAVEEAMSYSILLEHFGYTHEQCAEQVGRERSTISNYLRILTLPAEIRNDLVHERMSMGHCRALLSLPTVELMLEARKIILKRELSVRQTELLCKNINVAKDKSTPVRLDAEMEQLASGLRDRLKTKVRVSGSESRGRIEISYFSSAELERVLSLMGFSN